MFKLRLPRTLPEGRLVIQKQPCHVVTNPHTHPNEYSSWHFGEVTGLFRVMNLLFQFTSRFELLPCMPVLTQGRSLAWEMLPSSSLTRIRAACVRCHAEKLLLCVEGELLVQCSASRGFCWYSWPQTASVPVLSTVCRVADLWAFSALSSAGLARRCFMGLHVTARKNLLDYCNSVSFSPEKHTDLEEQFFKKKKTPLRHLGNRNYIFQDFCF